MGNESVGVFFSVQPLRSFEYDRHFNSDWQVCWPIWTGQCDPSFVCDGFFRRIQLDVSAAFGKPRTAFGYRLATDYDSSKMFPVHATLRYHRFANEFRLTFLCQLVGVGAVVAPARYHHLNVTPTDSSRHAATEPSSKAFSISRSGRGMSDVVLVSHDA